MAMIWCGRELKQVKHIQLARSWAQSKIDDLQLYPNDPCVEQQILALAQHYSIVTPNTRFLSPFFIFNLFTSLIVIDSLEQYLNYDIEPSIETQPELFIAFHLQRGLLYFLAHLVCRTSYTVTRRRKTK